MAAVLVTRRGLPSRPRRPRSYLRQRRRRPRIGRRRPRPVLPMRARGAAAARRRLVTGRARARKAARIISVTWTPSCFVSRIAPWFSLSSHFVSSLYLPFIRSRALSCASFAASRASGALPRRRRLRVPLAGVGLEFRGRFPCAARPRCPTPGGTERTPEKRSRPTGVFRF